MFDKDADVSYYDILFKYAKLKAREVLEETDLSKEIKEHLNRLLDFNKPKNFKPNDRDNVLLIMDKSYQKTLFAFAENNIYNSETFTMFEFRTAIEMLKERNEKFKSDIDNLKQK